MDFPFPVTPDQVGGGTLISYVSLRTGAGASTLACMHAMYCAEKMDAAIIDFNPESKVRTYTGLPVDVSSASIIDLNGVTNAKSIYSAGEKINSNLYVYPNITRILDVPQVDANLSLKCATYLKQSFKSSIAVSGPLYGPTWPALLLSDLICIVLSPDRKDLDAFKDSMDFLNRLDCAERAKIILNQQGIPGGIRDDDLIKNYPIDYIIEYDRTIRANGNKRKLQIPRSARQMFNAIERGIMNNA